MRGADVTPRRGVVVAGRGGAGVVIACAPVTQSKIKNSIVENTCEDEKLIERSVCVVGGIC